MNSKLILSVFLALACAVASAKEDCTELAEWKEFKSKFNKHYASVQEENRRCQLWYEIYNDVHQHNADKTQTYTKAVYHFADWTPEEHKQFRFGYKPMGHPFRGLAERKELPVTALPASVDWKAKGAVTPIKNQGSCGSCWTFSVVGVMEGAYKIAKGSLFSFSEQQLVDCNTAYPQGGCNGGLPVYALRYVNKTGGLQLQSDYPYKATKQSTCSYKSATAKKVKIKSIVNLDDRDSQIRTALANVGPLSVCVCASPMSFSLYYSGIYNGVTCTPVGSDHAVLAVGYVKNSTTCYYVIKNSWGTSWGLNGYMNIACNTVSKNQTVDIYYPVLA